MRWRIELILALFFFLVVTIFSTIHPLMGSFMALVIYMMQRVIIISLKERREG